MGISQNQLAKDINVPANRVSQIIHGKREITASLVQKTLRGRAILLKF